MATDATELKEKESEPWAEANDGIEINDFEDEDIDITQFQTTMDDTQTNMNTNTKKTKSQSISNTNSYSKDDTLINLPSFNNNDLFSFEPLNLNDENDTKIDSKNNNKNKKNNKNNKNKGKQKATIANNNSNNNNNNNNNNSKENDLRAKIDSDLLKSKSQMNNKFSALSSKQLSKGERNYRAIRVPGPRMIHIRRLWKQICDPIVTQLKLQIRMNSKKNLIELRTSKHTTVTGAVQKGADFVRAAVLGFEIKDAIALIRMDDIYLESFDIRDVKFFNKKSDHWLRAVGRIAGQYGKIKYSIENSTNTRIVIFGFKVHILGSFTSIRLARNAISRLVMGSAPGNVYAKLRVVSNRMKNRF